MPRLQTPTLSLRLRQSLGRAQRHPSPRFFTYRPSLRIVARPGQRPQLPFLHPTLLPYRSHTVLGRYLSTETRERWRQRIRWQLRFQPYFWSSMFLLFVIWGGLYHSTLEHEFPTPRDWSFWSRWYLRVALQTEFKEDAKIHGVLTDWGKAAWYYNYLLERLENPNMDGKGLRDQDEGGYLIEGVGKTGFDVSMKSEQWRRGYYQAMMGAARAAEHLDGMCKRKGEIVRKTLYPKDAIPGPSNPRPRQLPWDKQGGHFTIPNEFEVEDAFPAPEVFYMRILTTNGFDTRQRLDAALSYADWCDFKGLHDTAQSTYDWALDIAAGALPIGADGVVDIRTGVINKNKEEYVSENMLKATTALGVHHARSGEVKEALPILLSVLRARKTLPAAPMYFNPAKPPVQPTNEAPNTIYQLMLDINDFLTDTPYPKGPSDGNERPFHTLKEACEEVGLMTYIGEILFATSDAEKEKGLSWTRDSVEAAEAIMWVMDEQKQNEGRERCRQCLETGLENWKAMANQMVRLAAKKEVMVKESSGVLGLGIGKEKEVKNAQDEVKRWQEEEEQVELRKQKTLPLLTPGRPVKGTLLSV